MKFNHAPKTHQLSDTAIVARLTQAEPIGSVIAYHICVMSELENNLNILMCIFAFTQHLISYV